MKIFIKYFVLLFSLNFIEGSRYRCDYQFIGQANAWFKPIAIPANWFDARLRCALEGATIASPTTIKLKAEMINLTKNFFGTDAEIFTGFHATFSQGDYFTIEGIPLSQMPAKHWAENEPDNKNNNESCITLNRQGDLADRPCEETHPYICQGPGDIDMHINECGTLDPEYHLDTRTQSCYKFHTVPRNFSRAHLACTAEGGHLAIINSDTEAKVLKELFSKFPAGKMEGNFWKDVAFVGIHDWREEMEWRTIHGQTLVEAGYSKFSGGEPNNASPGENCGAIYRSGLIDDLWCNRPAAFICEKSPSYPALCEIYDPPIE